MGIDPYEAKVQQLRELFVHLNIPALRVRVLRENAMRSRRGGEASQGSVAIKNAVIIDCHQQNGERSSTGTFYGTWICQTKRGTRMILAGFVASLITITVHSAWSCI